VVDKTTEVTMTKLPPEMTLLVKIKGLNRLIFRLKLGQLLIRLAGHIMGCSIDIEFT